ncbi:hypothetical protein V3C99_014986 [Haemonchus contortus]
MATARRIMLSVLAVRQKVNGYNLIVIPKLKYAISCIIYGNGRFCTMRKQVREFDEAIRKLLAETHMRFGHSCVARLYVNKEQGGLGLKSAEEEMEHTIVYTWCYLASHPDFQRQVAGRVLSSNENTGLAYVCHKDSFLWSQTGWVPSTVLRNAWAAQEGRHGPRGFLSRTKSEGSTTGAAQNESRGRADGYRNEWRMLTRLATIMAEKRDIIYVDTSKFFRVVRIMNGMVSFLKSAMDKLMKEGRPKSSAETIKALEERIATLEKEKRRATSEDFGPKKEEDQEKCCCKK